MNYMVDLEAFHGPLDLLLYLIGKNEVDIYDIPIAQITDQYIEHINRSGDIDLEPLGDFLVLASYLLSLKSKMLLPKHNSHEKEESDEIDPRDELVQRLLEYKKFKAAAIYLASIQQEDHQVFLRNAYYDGEVNEILVAEVKSLVNAYKEVLSRLAVQNHSVEIPAGDINVAVKMQELLEVLYNNPAGVIFQDLFKGINSRREALAYFLALLELIRLQRVKAVQKNINDFIIINLTGE